MKKKYTMAWAAFLVGAVLVFTNLPALGAWTAFSVTILGVFSAADVADKKLNGGSYDGNSNSG